MGNQWFCDGSAGDTVVAGADHGGVDGDRCARLGILVGDEGPESVHGRLAAGLEGIGEGAVGVVGGAVDTGTAAGIDGQSTGADPGTLDVQKAVGGDLTVILQVDIVRDLARDGDLTGGGLGEDHLDAGSLQGGLISNVLGTGNATDGAGEGLDAGFFGGGFGGDNALVPAVALGGDGGAGGYLGVAVGTPGIAGIAALIAGGSDGIV